MTDCHGRNPLTLQHGTRYAWIDGSAWSTSRIAWLLAHADRPVRLFSYLRRCGLRLGWELPERTQLVALGDDALLLSEPGAPAWTLRRLDVGDLCARTPRPPAARLTAAGRTVSAAATSGEGHDAQTAAAVAVIARGAPLPLLRRGRARTAVVSVAGGSELRWRIGAGRWRTAVRRGADGWTLRLPAPRRPAVELELSALFAAAPISAASYRLRLSR